MQVIHKSRPFHSNQFRRPGPASHKHHDPAGRDTVRSAARLAAEAAFSAPVREVVAESLPQVSIRKVRHAGPVPLSAAAEVAPPLAEADARVVRVFRLDKAPDLQGADGSATPEGPPVAPFLDQGIDDSSRHLKRTRRRLADRLPGPVVIATPAPPPDTRYDGEVTTLPQLEALDRHMAGLGPIIEGIRLAQSLLLTDESIADDWRRLTLAADGLSREIAEQVG